MLIPQSQLSQDLNTIEQCSKTVILAVAAAATALNDSYNFLWRLPDDRLAAVLQYLYDNNLLWEIFTDHNYAAVSINGILESYEYRDIRCFDVAGRQFQIVDGVIVIDTLSSNATLPPNDI